MKKLRLFALLTALLLLLVSCAAGPSGESSDVSGGGTSAGESEGGVSQNVVMRFVVASDTHVSSTDSTEAQRLAKLFTSAYAYAETQEYKSVDAAVFVGDITNNGNASEYTAFQTVVKQNCKDSTKVCVVMGNHEYYGGGKPVYQQYFSKDTNYHFTVNGYHFICLSLDADDTFSTETIAFLKEEIAKAAEEDPDQPIFVFQHRHILNTVYVSPEWYSGQSFQINNILKKYPQVIDFSGHSHAPINNPTSFYQSEYTLVGTGTLTYFEMASGMTYGTIPPEADKAAQYWIVEVHDDQSVELKPYDILTDAFFKTPSNTDAEDAEMSYTVDIAKGKEGFLYTDRAETADTPYFEEGAELSVEDVRQSDLTLVIPQAKDGECIYSYRILLQTADSEQELDYFSEYYFEPLPDSISCSVTGLQPSTEYTISVYPVDCYGKEGNPISMTVTTTEAKEVAYSSALDVEYTGTFANFNFLSTLKISDNSLVYGGVPNGDVFVGDWESGSTGTGCAATLNTTKGYKGSNALGVSSSVSANQGLYIFANDTNGFSTEYTNPEYLRVWVDFTGIDFRKAGFGVFTSDGSLYDTDEIDGSSNLYFYYLAEGSTEWVKVQYGWNDGCFGTAEGSSVKGYKGWMAFPLSDFAHRNRTGNGTVASLARFNGNEIAGVYLYWDYDKSDNYTGKEFYLDEIQLVEDYTVFETYGG